jgi:hypothetical protein
MSGIIDYYLQPSPCLFSFAQNEDISLSGFCTSENTEDVFHLPLSNEAFQEYQEVQQITHGLNLLQNNSDIWTFKWENNYTPNC